MLYIIPPLCCLIVHHRGGAAAKFIREEVFSTLAFFFNSVELILGKLRHGLCAPIV